jgi:uridine monophosphate synthetase
MEDGIRQNMGFFNYLEARVREVESLLCVGLDPHPDELSAPTPQAAKEFCLRLIDATTELAAAFKPNAAFFEALGPQGIEVLQQVVQAVPDGIPVILDVKRGDIASSAEAYARAAFQVIRAHALTVNPYLGADSIAPFIADPARGVFLLCKTSNPGAVDLQDLRLVGKAKDTRVFEEVALLARELNKNDNLGLVVGATQPEALASVRALAPELWILTPGIGVQGGELRAALQAGLRQDGMGLLVSVSRLLSRAADPRQAALELRDAINLQRKDIASRSPAVGGLTAAFSGALTGLADALLEAGCVRFGEFTLKSGLYSPIYIDLRQLVGYPRLLGQVAEAYLPLLEGLSYDRLAALPYAALPIATAISQLSGRPLVYPRKEAKSYGTRLEVEGPFHAGERAVVIDDLATTGGSKFEAIEKLEAAGLRVSDVVVLIDRQSGAAQALAHRGYHLHAVFPLDQLLEHWERTGRISAQQVAAVREFLANASAA